MTQLKVDRRAPDWGTLTVGQTRVPLRLVVGVAGGLLWLLVMIVQTGEHAFTALSTNLLFLVPLILLGSLTRTVSLRILLVLFLTGAFLMGVMLVAGIFLAPLGDLASGLIGPLLEEVLKIAPVVYLLWRWRARQTWWLGATDVLLMAAVSGAGFGIVEDAHIRAKFGWPAQIDWLPVTEIVGSRVIPGHAIWTTIAGAGLGLALMVRHLRLPAIALAIAGFAWSAADHVTNNMGTLEILGTLSIVLLFVGVVAAIGIDLYVLGRPRPSVPEFSTPSSADSGGKGLAMRWSFVTGRRALAYALWRFANAPDVERDGPTRAVDAAARSLIERHLANAPSPAIPTTTSGR
ncbi:MAG: PrsW family glutamic-type intramembrane protease [Chloroflexota bacterium]